MRTRSRAVAPLAAVLLLTACGDPDPLTATDEEVVAARDRATESMTAGLQALAGEFGAGTPLGTRVDTRCSAGTDNWKIHDRYRSTCSTSITTAFATDRDPQELLSDVAALDAFEDRLSDVGWGGAEWFVAGETGMPLDAYVLGLSGRPLPQLSGVRVYDGEGTSIALSFHRADEPVPAPDPPLHPTEPYPAEGGGTQGTDWQDAWTGQTSWLLTGGGDAEIAQQPW